MLRILFVASILLIGAANAFAQKTDIIELANGDRITCEFKKLDRGKVTAKTDNIGTLSIEWDDVRRIKSLAYYDVEFTSGRHVYGSLDHAATAGAISIISATAIAEEFQLSEIIRITPLGRTFWRRLDGAVDAGFSFTTANVQTDWTFHTNVSHRSQNWLSTLNADSTLTYREDADRQLRNTVSLSTQRFVKPKVTWIAFTQFQQNDELSLELRALAGGGVVRTLVQSNKTELRLLGALVFTNEEYVGEDQVQVAEAAAGGSWEWFTFDGRSTSLKLDGLTYYTLQSDSRFRLELNASFRSDIVGDLYWSINGFESYNSQPPQNQKKNDFGVNATIGWTF